MDRQQNIDETATVLNSRITAGARVYKNTFVRNCVVKDEAVIGDFTRIENSQLDEYVKLQRNNLIYNTSFGRHSYTGKNTTIWHANIGAFCSISWNVSIGGANHDYRKLTTHSFLYAPEHGLLGENTPLYNRFDNTCRIGNDVWLGCGAIVCRNVVIGDGAVIGAGAVVTHDVEPYSIMVGSPARKIKLRFATDIVERLLALRWWDLSDEIITENIELFNCEPNHAILERLEMLKGEKL